jgi:hypothetical protein
MAWIGFGGVVDGAGVDTLVVDCCEEVVVCEKVCVWNVLLCCGCERLW